MRREVAVGDPVHDLPHGERYDEGVEADPTDEDAIHEPDGDHRDERRAEGDEEALVRGAADADGQAMKSSFTTGYFALAEADVKSFIDQVWPDMKWGYYGGAQNATVNMTFNYVDYPSQYATPQVSGPFVLNNATTFVSPRMRGRLVQVNLNSSDVGSFWRIGGIRYRFQQDGKY